MLVGCRCLSQLLTALARENFFDSACFRMAVVEVAAANDEDPRFAAELGALAALE